MIQFNIILFFFKFLKQITKTNEIWVVKNVFFIQNNQVNNKIVDQKL